MIGSYWIWIAIGAQFLASVLAAIHLALRNSSRVSLEEHADDLEAKHAARRLRAVAADLESHAHAVGLPRVVCTLLIPVGFVAWIAALRGSPAPQPADVAIGVAIASALHWLVGMVLPASIARHLPEQTVIASASFIRLARLLTLPVSGIGRTLDEIVRRLAGRTKPDSIEALEADLLSVVEEHGLEGELDETTRSMLEKVVGFGSTTVEEIMTPRTDMVALAYTDDLKEVKAFIRDANHSRIPVYRDSLDTVAGVLYAKDLLNWMTTASHEQPFRLADILRPPSFVPETKTVRELLAELLANRVHLAIAADEYGGTAGVVTIEDIVEEVFGDIQDEYDTDDEQPAIDIDPTTRSAEVDAKSHIDDLNDALEDLDIELPESEDYDTLGGFVVVRLGHIPSVGESVMHEDIRITVLEAEPTRVRRLRVEKVALTHEEAPADENTHSEQPAK